MKLLILGGTKFLGRQLVEASLAGGHEVTLFNRGKENPHLFPEVEKLQGDRDGGLAVLRNRRWDAVIDPSGYVPRIVRDSAELLADLVDHYTFISSISVYSHFNETQQDESAPVGQLSDETVEEVNGDTYGPLKVLCEREVENAMDGRALLVRPGLIVGPYDSTDRFTYWPSRVSQGGEVLAPGGPDQPVQLIDARDLAIWIVSMIESKKTGVYNATGPGSPLTMGQLLEECGTTLDTDASLTWVSEEFLLENEVGPWIEVPLWLPASLNMPGFSTVNCQKALNEGLTFRPLADTIRDTCAWDSARSHNEERKAGMNPDRERELLHAWRNRT